MPDGDPIIKWVGGTINVYCDPAGGLYPPPVSEIEQALKEMLTDCVLEMSMLLYQ